MNNTAVKPRKIFTIPRTAIFAHVPHPGGGDPSEFLSLSGPEADGRPTHFSSSFLNEDAAQIGVERDVTGEVAIVYHRK
jgi:hypothetical protein